MLAVKHYHSLLLMKNNCKNNKLWLQLEPLKSTRKHYFINFLLPCEFAMHISNIFWCNFGVCIISGDAGLPTINFKLDSHSTSISHLAGAQHMWLWKRGSVGLMKQVLDKTRDSQYYLWLTYKHWRYNDVVTSLWH